MADTKTITQELTESGLDLNTAINTIKENLDGVVYNGSHDEIKNILNKIIEKIDEVTTEVNTIKNS